MAMVELHQGKSVSQVDYTPSGAAVSNGDVVVVGDVPMVAQDDIADGRKGALSQRGGVYRATADDEIATGKRVFWDATAEKMTETAVGNHDFGYTVSGSGADGDEIIVVHEPNAVVPAE